MDRVTRGQKKHRHLAARLAQSGQNLPAIQVGKHDVQNDEIELHFLRQVQPVQPVTGHVDNVARFAKSLLQELGGLGFVFDDQNSHTLDWWRAVINLDRELQYTRPPVGVDFLYREENA